MLLDELLDDARCSTRRRRARSSRRCSSARLHGVAPNDVEATLDAIRVFQRTAIFRIAIADRLGSLPLMKVSDRLTDTAELVLEFSLRDRVARARREARHAALRAAAA